MTKEQINLVKAAILRYHIQRCFPQWNIKEYRGFKGKISDCIEIEFIVETDTKNIEFYDLKTLSEIVRTNDIDLKGNNGQSPEICTDRGGFVKIFIHNAKYLNAKD
jgi:hypothetical protein